MDDALYAAAVPGSLVAHILGRNYTRACMEGRWGERKKDEGWEEATERGIVSSHCSIKSVGNDQD